MQSHCYQLCVRYKILIAALEKLSTEIIMQGNLLQLVSSTSFLSVGPISRLFPRLNGVLCESISPNNTGIKSVSDILEKLNDNITCCSQHLNLLQFHTDEIANAIYKGNQKCDKEILLESIAIFSWHLVWFYFPWYQLISHGK